MSKLPRKWTNRTDLGQLTAALGADNIRWVGGAVRDALLGEPVADIDAATTLVPDEVVTLCKGADIRTVPTGIDHGTITAVLPEGPVEVTTLRRDVSTDGRRATVAYAKDWREDAARRDFTINALYAQPDTLEISDYFDGLEDLAARRVKFIGNAHERIREDHLRILRYFRFQARFGADLDQDAIDACRDLAATLKGLSRERVAMELLKILALPDPTQTVGLMATTGVLPVIVPEAVSDHGIALQQLVESESSATVAPDPIRRLAALIPKLPTIAEGVAARLRLSKAQRAQLQSLAERGPLDVEKPRDLAYREGKDVAIDRLLLAGSDVDAVAGWVIPELPLKGGEIVEQGLATGPGVARLLQAVESRWIEEGFPSRDRVLELLGEESANPS